MKITVLLLAAGIAAAASGQEGSSGKAASEPDLKEALIAREKQSWEAWKNRDGRFFQDFLSNDHVEIGFGGITDKAAVVAGVGSPACVVNSYTVDQFELRHFGPDTAL